MLYTLGSGSEASVISVASGDVSSAEYHGLKRTNSETRDSKHEEARRHRNHGVAIPHIEPFASGRL